MSGDAWVVTEELVRDYENASRTVAAFSTEERAQAFAAMRLESVKTAEKMLDEWAERTSSDRNEYSDLEYVCKGWRRNFDISDEDAEAIKAVAQRGDPAYEGANYAKRDEWGDYFALEVRRVALDPEW